LLERAAFLCRVLFWWAAPSDPKTGKVSKRCELQRSSEKNVITAHNC